jgi:hypothetical protein
MSSTWPTVPVPSGSRPRSLTGWPVSTDKSRLSEQSCCSAANPPPWARPHQKGLITGQWPAEPRSASDTEGQLLGINPDSRLSFVAVLVDDDQSHTTGIVAIVRAHPGEALRLIQPFADQLAGVPVALTAQRWRRGGRS